MDSDFFTHQDLKKRKCNWIANLLSQVHEEGIGIHTRISEMVIWDKWATIGKSSPSSSYREHVVPLSYLTKTSIQMFKENKSVEEVAQFWFDYYLVAFITREEAKILNSKSGLKTGMPSGWKVGDDPRRRLWEAGIKLDTDPQHKVAG